MQTERCINCYCSLTLLAFSILLKVFLIVFCFTNTLFKRNKCIKVNTIDTS